MTIGNGIYGNRDDEPRLHMSGGLPKVYLVRHGETAWTKCGQHSGHTDIPLTERGEREAQELRAARLRGLTFATVLTSPLQRGRRTGKLAGFAECVHADPDSMEWDYGAYEGQRSSDIRAERPGRDLFEDGCFGGETLEDLSTRADRVIARVRALDGDVLIFFHMEILRILAARWVAPRHPGRLVRRHPRDTGSPRRRHRGWSARPPAPPDPPSPGSRPRRLYLETASVRVLGYDHDLDEPVIRLWNARDIHGAFLTPIKNTIWERL